VSEFLAPTAGNSGSDKVGMFGRFKGMFGRVKDEALSYVGAKDEIDARE